MKSESSYMGTFKLVNTTGLNFRLRDLHGEIYVIPAEEKTVWCSPDRTELAVYRNLWALNSPKVPQVFGLPPRKNNVTIIVTEDVAKAVGDIYGEDRPDVVCPDEGRADIDNDTGEITYAGFRSYAWYRV